MGRKVLVIDTDPQANATLGLGVYPESVHKNIYHYYMARCNSSESEVALKDYIIKTVSGIDLVPSHLDLVGAEAILYQNSDRYRILESGIAPLKKVYDYILIDTPPFLGQFLMNGMIAADYSVIVFSSDTFAMAGYDHINLVIGDINEILGIKIKIGMAILNRWKAPSVKTVTLFEKIQQIFGQVKEEKPDSLQEIRNYLEKRIRVEIPEVVIVREGTEVSQSIKQGIPLITLAPEDAALPGFIEAANMIEKWESGGK
jgi:chromosome partitioning protein